MKTSRHPLRALLHAKIESRIIALICALLIGSPFLASDAGAQISVSTAQADPASAQTTTRGKSTVRGRVVYDDTDRPLRRVRVAIYDPASSGRRYRGTWTDGKGEFILRNVEAGKYYVTVQAPGIIRQDVTDAEDKLSETASVSVNGTNSAEVKVRARRGGTISGKVTYSDGEPAINALISVVRKQGGQLAQVSLNEDCGEGLTTDERGLFRVSGLPPGEYVVGASEQKMRETPQENDLEGANITRVLLATTYYEASTSPRSATAVEVDTGSEANNVNITLIERSTHKISGTVTMRGDGRPLTQAMMTLENRDEPNGLSSNFETQSATPDAQGRWAFEDVVDGAYTIAVAPAQQHDNYSPGVGAGSNRPPPPPVFIVKRQDVTLSGADLTGLLIEVSSGGRISGTVTVDGGRPLPSDITIYPETANGERRIQLPGPALVQRDGTFMVEGMPPDGVWVRAVSRIAKYYTKSATANGIDLMEEPLIVNEGGEVKGVRIVISPDVATLTGRVLVSEGGAPLRGAIVLLVPAESHRQRIRSARLYGYTNAEGGFTITGAPDDYLAIILRPGTEANMLGDEGFKARLATAQRVTLQPNERKNMDFIAPASK